MSHENDENLKNKFDDLENQIQAINLSLQKLLENSERQTNRREAGWLIMGVILGGLLSISVNLWTDFYMEVVKPELNLPILIVVTIFMVVFFVFLTRWSIRRLSE